LEVQQAIQVLRKQHNERENQEAEKLCKLAERSFNEAHIPLLPLFYWHEARDSYVYGLFNGSIALSGIAAESSLKEFIGESLRSLSVTYVIALLDQTEFSRLIQIARRWRIIENKTYSEFDKIRKLRNKYTHSNIKKIIKPLQRKMGEITETEQDTGRIVSKHIFGSDEFEKAFGVYMQSEVDSLRAINLVERIFIDIFVHKGSLQIADFYISSRNIKSLLLRTPDQIYFEGFGFEAEGKRIVDKLDQLRKENTLSFIAYDMNQKRITGQCKIVGLHSRELSNEDAPVKHTFRGTLKAKVQSIR